MKCNLYICMIKIQVMFIKKSYLNYWSLVNSHTSWSKKFRGKTHENLVILLTTNCSPLNENVNDFLPQIVLNYFIFFETGLECRRERTNIISHCNTQIQSCNETISCWIVKDKGARDNHADLDAFSCSLIPNFYGF